MRESAPRRGTETGANLKFQVKILESEPQENLSVIRRDILQNIEDPSAVSKRVPSVEDDLGLGNTETEAPESTRKSRPDRVSRTNRREGQLISEAEDKVSHSILAKEQGFLQLIASLPCFLWNQHRPDWRVGSFM